MRTGKIAGLLTLGVLVLSSPSASAAVKVKYVLDWLPAGYIGFAEIAQKEGFFAQQGLDVQIDIGHGGSDAITRVAAGGDDFGSANIGTLMDAAAGGDIPVKAVASVYTMAPDAIVTIKGSGVNSIKDLAGKTLATATYSGSNTEWPVIARLNGVDPASVNLLKMDDSALGPMLAAGKTDAVISWVMTAPLYSSLLPPGKSLEILPWTNYGVSGYNWSLLASDRMIKNHPDTVKKFVTAYLQAVQFTIANPEKAAADVHDEAPDTDTAQNLAELKATIPLLKNEITDKYGFGTFNAEILAQSWKWVAQSQNYPMDKINPEDVVDRSFVTAK